MTKSHQKPQRREGVEMKRKKIEWKKRTYRSKFFKIMRKMLKKSGKPAYRRAVKEAIRKFIGNQDTYRAIEFFFILLNKMGFKRLMKKLFCPKETYRKENKRVEIKESNNLTDLEEVEEFRDIGEGTLKERMSDLLLCGLKPVSFKEA